jgi:hypothetical protein
MTNEVWRCDGLCAIRGKTITLMNVLKVYEHLVTEEHNLQGLSSVGLDGQQHGLMWAMGCSSLLVWRGNAITLSMVG